MRANNMFQSALMLPAILVLVVSLQVKAVAASDTLSLRFQSGSPALSVGAKSQLDSLMKSHARWDSASVSIFGWSDSSGARIANFHLSQKRADAVRDYLKERMLPDSAIAICEGMGVAYQFPEKPEQRCVQVIIRRPDPRPKYVPKVILKRGKRIELAGLLFKEGTAVMVPHSIPVLKELHAALERNPAVRIHIVGHICCEGMLGISNYSRNLSTNRAKAVYDYLVTNGIDAKRLSYEGLGFLEPLVFPENNNVDQARNRRVEIKVL